MSIDDFIVPSSVASPTGFISPAPIDNSVLQNTSQDTTIPGRQAKQQQKTPMGLPPASVPKNIAHPSRAGEFDYVQRRVRKTSIDERSVRLDTVFLRSMNY